MKKLPLRSLGSSNIEVSVMSLGSWKTLDRLPREISKKIFRSAVDAGINFFDDANYADETGKAPIKTGYSEVVFGEMFRETLANRKDAVVANKLWWGSWPHQTALEELKDSLDRMRFEYIDLIYCLPPPAEVGVRGAVEQIRQIIEFGMARVWGVANWQHDQISLAVTCADEMGITRPCVAQLPFSLAQRDWVESEEMAKALLDAGIGLVASHVLAGGTLTGKYLRGETGRATYDSATEATTKGKQLANDLSTISKELNISSTHLALSFALQHPALSSLLFGASSMGQLCDNVGAVDTFNSLSQESLRAIRRVGV